MRTQAMFFVTLLLAGCAGPSASYELRTARDTIREAKSGIAARYEPEQVRRAGAALRRAELAEDGSMIERDLAYVADREARIAIADATARATEDALAREQRAYQSELEHATIAHEQALRAQRVELEQMRRELAGVRSELDRVRGDLAERGQTLDERTRELSQREQELARREQELIASLEARSAVESRLGETQAELARVQGELASVRGELDQRGQLLDATTRELARRERELAVREGQLEGAIQARVAAEERAQQAMRALAALASVREENGDTIVTLSGEVLFEYDQADLRPMARQRLRAVADALKAQPDAQIVVAGHTDTRGSAQYNRDLSARRAEAVRQFLIAEGVDPNRIRAEGAGEAEPIASNDTPEGRANNRRVEIVIHPAAEQRVSLR